MFHIVSRYTYFAYNWCFTCFVFCRMVIFGTVLFMFFLMSLAGGVSLCGLIRSLYLVILNKSSKPGSFHSQVLCLTSQWCVGGCVGKAV